MQANDTLLEILDEGDDDFNLDGEDKAKASVAANENVYFPLIQLYTFFLFMFQTLFRISDTAMNILLKFLSMFFTSVGKQVSLPTNFTSALPDSLYSARKFSCNARDQFKRYVCCPTCHSLYSFEECVIKLANGHMESKTCSFTPFPTHPQRQHRTPCGTPLLKRVKTKSGKLSLYPRLVYCYKSIIDSLQEMLKRPDFLEKCELWRSEERDEGLLTDVYDGEIWREFLEPGGIPFLNLPNNFAFQINVDWFRPFQHTQHSEGAIYMTIMNLPRKERFLQENVILVGVIPGPSEPSLHINTLLTPLVNELNQLWKGITLKNCFDHPVLVRAALLCCSCDVPAARKVCGFCGHRAKKGCSKCLMTFPVNAFGELPDYSNFDRSLWTPRTNEHHRMIAQRFRKSKTRAQQQDIEKEFGIRYSVLLELPYFDAARMCVVDPMHNLLLGTARHMVDTWKEKQILSKKHFDDIQQKVDSFVSPSDIGRVPMKISSGFAGFTAEQWKNWTIFYSLFALKDILPSQHYNCWHLFVKVCFLLCRRSIAWEQIQEADQIIFQFLRLFKQLYGAEKCNINMHLHGHLAKCIEDFGPVYSFWCFAYERMNGILGAYPTNTHHISVQYMRRFLDSKSCAPAYWPPEYVNEYFPVLKHCTYQKGSLMQTNLETEISEGTFSPLPPIQEESLTSSQMQELHSYFQNMLDGQSFQILMLCRHTKALSVGDFILGAKGSQHSKSHFVLAHRSHEQIELAEILCFLECIAITSDSRTVKLWTACIKWYMTHPCKVWYGHPVEVWTTTSSPGSFLIPVRNISSRVVHVKCTRDFGRSLTNDTVYVVVPLMSNRLHF